jgi:hypothetical protein
MKSSAVDPIDGSKIMSSIQSTIAQVRGRGLWSAAVTVAVLNGAVLGQSSGNGKFDLDHDGQISAVDMALMTEQFGPCQACRSDVNADGVVDQLDLAALIGHMGEPVVLQDQQAMNDVKIVHEAFPGQMPIDPDPAPPVVPVTTDLAGFVAANSVHDLGPVAPERIALADELHAIQYEGIYPGPSRIGFTRELDPPLSLPEAAAQTELGAGEFLWAFAVRSPGSFETRLHLEKFDVGRSEVILFAPRADGSLEVHGPYRGRGPEGDGDFWPPSVTGDTVYVEIRGPDAPQFEVVESVHNDRDRLALPIDPQDNGGEGGIAGNCVPAMQVFPCQLDVMCEPVNEFARQATGQMTFVCDTNGNCSVCTGTLLNDLDDETAVPYFITAFHCLSTQAEVNTLQITWFFQNTSCNSGVIGPTQTSSGGTLLVTNDTDDGNDMTFIRLNSAPSGIPLAGWTTASLGSGHGIHHPAGTFKRATWFTSGSGICADVFDYDYYEVTEGATQGGSSGSGIFNSSGQLSGQLLGTCGIDCGNNDVACANQPDYDKMYGEFESTWEDTNVSYWLTLGGTLWVWNGSPNLPGNGTAGDPYGTVNQANNVAWDGSQIKIIAGSYDETLTISKAVTVEAVNGAVVIGQ